jgi:hypothetical protein
LFGYENKEESQKDGLDDKKNNPENPALEEAPILNDLETDRQ